MGLTASCCDSWSACIVHPCSELTAEHRLEGCAVGTAVGLHGNRKGFFGLLAGVLFVVWHCANTAEKRVWKLWLGVECLSLLC